MNKIIDQKELQSLLNNFLDQNKDGVVEILGPTASGKTGLSIQVAHELQKQCGKKVEIICVDSRQVYRGCDISSAKPDTEEMAGIIHHGLDLVDLNEEYNVVRFQKYAFKMIAEILERGNVPILCGGTMLWLDAVSENYVFSQSPHPRSLSQGEREVFSKSDEKLEPKYPFLKIGITWPRETLYNRINERATQQFEGGLIEETQQILAEYNPPLPLGEGWGEGRLSLSAWTSFGYQEIKAYLEGFCTYEEALQKNQQRNRNYAKRQLTWWRGREDVYWINRV